MTMNTVQIAAAMAIDMRVVPITDGETGTLGCARRWSAHTAWNRWYDGLSAWDKKVALQIRAIVMSGTVE